jgi:septal ring factor EnvC (AmiA/AmiB activator)
LIFKVMMVIGLSVSVFAQQISDVSANSAEYSAVQHSVNKGYFSLVDGNQFLPNQSVTRSELALILQRLDTLSAKSDLSNQDIAELKDFSVRFKKYLANQETSTEVVGSEVSLIQNEQKAINYDISRLEEKVQIVKKKRKEQETFLWIALGLSVLSILK